MKPLIPPIILASKSPRRHQLLRDAGIPFRVMVKDLLEVYPEELSPPEIAAYLAELKASPFAEEAQSSLIIAADTIVWDTTQLLGKPADRKDAIRILTQLSGRMHQVITGIHLHHQEWHHSFTETTNVYFKPLSIDQIEWYIDHFSVMDKAGAYGIQDWAGLTAVERIEGDFYNVMGLPVCRLVKEIETKFYLPFQSPDFYDTT
jgi:septum formation protein